MTKLPFTSEDLAKATHVADDISWKDFSGIGYWRRCFDRWLEEWRQRKTTQQFGFLLAQWQINRTKGGNQDALLEARLETRERLLLNGWRSSFRRWWHDKGQRAWTTAAQRVAGRFPEGSHPKGYLPSLEALLDDKPVDQCWVPPQEAASLNLGLWLVQGGKLEEENPSASPATPQTTRSEPKPQTTRRFSSMQERLSAAEKKSRP